MNLSINMNSEKIRQNPYPAYEEIRRIGSAVYDSHRNVWYIGRYNDVSRILRDRKCLSNRETGFETSLHGADGTLHTYARNIIRPAFTPERVAELEADICSLVEKLVTNIARQEEFDLIENLAARIPASVVAWLLGIDDTRWVDIRHWSSAIVSGGTKRRTEKKNNWTVSTFHNVIKLIKSKKQAETANTIAECEAFLIDHFNFASRNPGNSWITDQLVSHRERNELTTEQLLDIGLLLIVAGNETTTDLIGNAVLFLAKNTDIQHQLQKNPKLLKSFIEEILRYDSPVQRRLRIARSPIQVGDVTVPEGARIEVLIGSANRDPDQFPDADAFRLDRKDNRHLAFGGGTHFCLGAQFARIESYFALNALIRELPLMTLAHPGESIEYPDAFSLRGPRKLHIRFG